MVEINVDQKVIKSVEKALRNIPNGSKRAIANATNRAITKGRTTISKEITSEFTIKAKDVKATLSLQKATVSRLGGVVKSSAPVTTLIRFKTTPKTVTKKRPAALKVAVKKGGYKTLPGAFIVQTKSGHIGVFERSKESRLPIKQIMGPSIPYMAKGPNVSSTVQKDMTNMFYTRLEHEMTRLLKKY